MQKPFPTWLGIIGTILIFLVEAMVLSAGWTWFVASAGFPRLGVLQFFGVIVGLALLYGKVPAERPAMTAENWCRRVFNIVLAWLVMLVIFVLGGGA